MTEYMPLEQEHTVYDLADVGTRFFAILIDQIILGVVGGIALGISSGTAPFLWFIVSGAYNWFFWTRHDGQTPGKSIMGIRVIKANGTPISDTDAVIRFIGYYINGIVIMLGWIWALFDPQRQGWHDKLANTYVVRA